MRSNKALRVFAPLLVGALLVSACGKSSSPSGSKTKTFTIGYQGPLSGGNQQLGINMDNAIVLAIDQANASGTLPFKLKYEHSDDVGDGGQAPAAAQKLIDDSNVIAVVGPAFSSPVAASGKKFGDANLTIMTPSATRADLTSDGFTSFVRIVTGDNIQGAKDADYIAKVLKAKSAYVVDDKSDYGAGLSKFVKQQLTTDGVTVTAEGIAAGTKDYSTVATKAKSSGADVLYYAGYYSDFALLARALKTAGFTGALFSDDGSKDPQYVKQAGAASANTYLSCPCGPTAASAAATKFAADYKAKFGTDPGTYSAESFDAANAIIAAMKTITGAITRASVLAAVKAVSYDGITHHIAFDSKGEGGTGDIFVYQVKNGQIVLLGNTDALIK
jgi:branched-chain amino acid transport system substrate-binding protein